MRVFVWKNEEGKVLSVRSFLKNRHVPGSLLSSLKEKEGSILVDGRPAKLRERLSGGEEIRLRLEEKEEQAERGLTPMADEETINGAETENAGESRTSADEQDLPVLPIHYLYEDEDILVIDKPPFLPMHSSMGHHEKTVARYVTERAKAKGEYFVFRCLNRLDRDTSGVTVVCKNRLSAAIMAENIRAGKVHRTYLAVAEGLTEPSGRIDAPIGRVDGSVILRQVDEENGQEAHTLYERIGVVSTGDDQSGQLTYSILKIRLLTGRTHQIRVHMKHIGHPLPGDFLYNPDYRLIRRQALHSWQMTFPHPITGEKMSFTASIPEDMSLFVDSMQIIGQGDFPECT